MSVFDPPIWQQALATVPWEWVLVSAVAGFVWTAVKLIRREGLTKRTPWSPASSARKNRA